MLAAVTGGPSHLIGVASNDTLSGHSANNNLDGDNGDDLLFGYAGNDSDAFGKGYGANFRFWSEEPQGAVDRMVMKENLLQADPSFIRSGDSFMAAVKGIADRLTHEDCHLGEQYQIAEFSPTNDDVLTNTQVQALVSAMAVFVGGVAPTLAGEQPTQHQVSLLGVTFPL